MLKRRRTEQDDLGISGFPVEADPSPARPAGRRRPRRRISFLRQIGVAAALLVLAYIALPFLLSARRMHPAVEAQLGSALGRRVRIGSLRFSPAFGALIASDVSVADDPAFSDAPFLHALEVELSLRRIPLIFGGRVDITDVSIEEPTVTLIRNGPQWNFYGLLAAGPAASDAGPGVSIEVRRGTVALRGGDRGEPFVMRDVNLSAPRFSTALENAFAIRAAVGGEGTLKADGKLGPVKWLGRSPVLPLHALVNAEKLSIAESNLMSTLAPAIGGVMTLAGSIDSDGTAAQFKANMTLSKLRLAANGESDGEPIVFDWVASYDPMSGIGKITRCDAALNKGSAGLTGTFSFAGDRANLNLHVLAQGAPVTMLSPLLAAVGLPLPPGSSLQGGVASMQLAIEGDVAAPATSGSVVLNNTKLMNFDLEDRLEPVSGLDMLTIPRDLPIDEFRTNVNVTPEKVVLTGLEMTVASIGTFRGSGEIARNRTLDFRMTAVRGGVSEAIPFVVRGGSVSPVFRQPGKTS
jgi:AsmA protein